MSSVISATSPTVKDIEAMLTAGVTVYLQKQRATPITSAAPFRVFKGDPFNERLR